MKIIPFTVSLILLLAGVQQAGAAATGKSAAMKYFTAKREPSQVSTKKASAASLGEVSGQLLAFSVGSLLNTKSYDWGDKEFNGWNVEVFYQRNTSGYFSSGYHLELQKFATKDDEFSKISFLLSLTFPRRLSFPVYLGVAAGPGFFLQQAEDESEFAIDYKAWLGLRLNEKHSQYFLHSGVKNHIHVLSDGQFIGWFISSGVAYKF